MSFILLAIFLMSSERPVIRLDEIEVTGTIRKPQVIELEKSHLDQKLERAALSNLRRLEKELLRPANLPQ